jgi:hypothetical protein
MAIQPACHRSTSMAKTLFNRVMPLISRPIVVDKAVPTLTARTPLWQIDAFSGPDVKHVSIVIKELLYMVLKSYYLAWTFEFNVNIFICDVRV